MDLTRGSLLYPGGGRRHGLHGSDSPPPTPKTPALLPRREGVNSVTVSFETGTLISFLNGNSHVNISRSSRDKCTKCRNFSVFISVTFGRLWAAAAMPTDLGLLRPPRPVQPGAWATQAVRAPAAGLRGPGLPLGMGVFGSNQCCTGAFCWRLGGP